MGKEACGPTSGHSASASAKSRLAATATHLSAGRTTTSSGHTRGSREVVEIMDYYRVLKKFQTICFRTLKTIIMIITYLWVKQSLHIQVTDFTSYTKMVNCTGIV